MPKRKLSISLELLVCLINTVQRTSQHTFLSELMQTMEEWEQETRTLSKRQLVHKNTPELQEVIKQWWPSTHPSCKTKKEEVGPILKSTWVSILVVCFWESYFLSPMSFLSRRIRHAVVKNTKSAGHIFEALGGLRRNCLESWFRLEKGEGREKAVLKPNECPSKSTISLKMSGVGSWH